jgi:hypothetical protein
LAVLKIWPLMCFLGGWTLKEMICGGRLFPCLFTLGGHSLSASRQYWFPWWFRGFPWGFSTLKDIQVCGSDTTRKWNILGGQHFPLEAKLNPQGYIIASAGCMKPPRKCMFLIANSNRQGNYTFPWVRHVYLSIITNG